MNYNLRFQFMLLMLALCALFAPSSAWYEQSVIPSVDLTRISSGTTTITITTITTHTVDMVDTVATAYTTISCSQTATWAAMVTVATSTSLSPMDRMPRP
jgi:hypothetical protein